MAEASARRDTKDLLLDAAEHLFARDGIHATRIREINEVAGQRNPSALHYHFGSRARLVIAIMLRHQSDIDTLIEPRLDELERDGTPRPRDVIEIVVRPTLAKLQTQSGRDWARILPQILPELSDNLRRGVTEPITPQTNRVLDMLRESMSDLPVAVQRERLVDYTLVLATLLGERAHELESGRPLLLDDERFVAHMTDVLVAVVTAPTTIAD